MIRKLLLTVIVFASASDVVLAGQNFAMLPFGSDANRHFYKDQNGFGMIRNSRCGQPSKVIPAHLHSRCRPTRRRPA